MIANLGLFIAHSTMLSFLFYRVLIPIARQFRLVRANSIYHTAAFYLRNEEVKGIIDGGSFDGRDAITLCELFPKAKCYAFEPSPESFPILTRAVKGKKQIHAVPEAIALDDGVAELHLNAYAPTSSLLLSDEGEDARALFKGRGETVRSVAVKTISLNSFAKEHPDFQFSLIKLDLQGAELSALQGGREILRDSVLAVVSEIRFRPLYVGDVMFQEIDAFLGSVGFKLVTIADATHHPMDDTLFEANALWVKARLVGG